MSSFTVKLKLVPQFGHKQIGCLIINSKVNPKGFLHVGQGNDIL